MVLILICRTLQEVSLKIGVPLDESEAFVDSACEIVLHFVDERRVVSAQFYA